MKPRSPMPPTLAPLGLGKAVAAAYVGVSENTFAAMVEAGSMPPPRRVGCRVLWSRLELDEYFMTLPTEAPAPEADTWDDVA